MKLVDPKSTEGLTISRQRPGSGSSQGETKAGRRLDPKLIAIEEILSWKKYS
jgi:hypothetical protein